MSTSRHGVSLGWLDNHELSFATVSAQKLGRHFSVLVGVWHSLTHPFSNTLPPKMFQLLVITWRCAMQDSFIFQHKVSLFQHQPCPSSIFKPLPFCHLLLLLLRCAADGRAGHGEYLITESLREQSVARVAYIRC